MIEDENRFYCELGKTIQKWGWVESSLYELYLAIMDGANQHSVSVTFNHIESFESKITLVDSCLKLILDQNSDDFKNWRKHKNKARDLNKLRNRIVHEPVKIGADEIYIGPSFMNSLALTKNQTTYKKPVISREYEPKLAQIEDVHKIHIIDLCDIRNKFHKISIELRDFRKSITKSIKKAHKGAQKKKCI